MDGRGEGSDCRADVFDLDFVQVRWARLGPLDQADAGEAFEKTPRRFGVIERMVGEIHVVAEDVQPPEAETEPRELARDPDGAQENAADTGHLATGMLRRA